MSCRALPSIQPSAVFRVRAAATTLDLLEHLANDRDMDVRKAASKRRAVADGEFAMSAAAVDLTTAARRALERAQLAGSGQPGQSPQLRPDDLLRALYWLHLVPQKPTRRFLAGAARSADWLTRLAVALHPMATEAQRRLLEKDEMPDVVAAARARNTALG